MATYYCVNGSLKRIGHALFILDSSFVSIEPFTEKVNVLFAHKEGTVESGVEYEDWSVYSRVV